MNNVYTYAIKLIRYILKGDVPELPENIDFESLFEFSKSHGVENMIYVGLRDLKIEVPEPTMQKFKEAYEMAIVVEAMQAIELEQISNAFEEAGIDHIPLKGSVVKYLYPDPSYRKSGDIDILIKPEDKKTVRKKMFENGYLIDKSDEYELHEGYRKPPFILTEIHDRLVEKNNRAYALLTDVWENAERKQNTKHNFKLRDEWQYIFSVAHFAKHIKNGGAGIKFVLDMYILSQEELEIDTVEEMLNKSNLSQFHGFVKEVVNKWFYDEDVSENAMNLEKFILDGGGFGTDEQSKLLKKSAIFWGRKEKIKYMFTKTYKGIFVSYESMRSKYPILVRHRYLLPIMWMVRLWSIITSKKSTVAHFKSAYDFKNENIPTLSEIWKSVC